MDLMAGRPTKAEYIDALAHLTAAVRDLQEIAVEPIALSGSSAGPPPTAR